MVIYGWGKVLNALALVLERTHHAILLVLDYYGHKSQIYAASDPRRRRHESRFSMAKLLRNKYERTTCTTHYSSRFVSRFVFVRFIDF